MGRLHKANAAGIGMILWEGAWAAPPLKLVLDKWHAVSYDEKDGCQCSRGKRCLYDQ